MYDPERDDDPGTRPFWARLSAVVGITIIGCALLWPVATGYTVGPDATHVCVAARDAFSGTECSASAQRRVAVTGMSFTFVASAAAIGIAASKRRRRQTRTNLRQRHTGFVHH